MMEASAKILLWRLAHAQFGISSERIVYANEFWEPAMSDDVGSVDTVVFLAGYPVGYGEHQTQEGSEIAAAQHALRTQRLWSPDLRRYLQQRAA